ALDRGPGPVLGVTSAEVIFRVLDRLLDGPPVGIPAHQVLGGRGQISGDRGQVVELAAVGVSDEYDVDRGGVRAAPPQARHDRDVDADPSAVAGQHDPGPGGGLGEVARTAQPVALEGRTPALAGGWWRRGVQDGACTPAEW